MIENCGELMEQTQTKTKTNGRRPDKPVEQVKKLWGPIQILLHGKTTKLNDI